MFDIEQNTSLQFYSAYLSNVRALILLFNNVIYKEHFILLPGDEITEKKHKNVRHLMAMERNDDMSRREMRNFPGCGACVFKIDFSKLQADMNASPADSGATNMQTDSDNGKQIPVNEINTEVSVKNTQHHKMIIKARNESYELYKTRFNVSVMRIMQKFDNDRLEEHRFNAYW